VKTVGLILAGGQGSRLGAVRKADLLIGGKTLLARVTGRLEGSVSQLLVSTGNGQLPLGAVGIGVADPDLPVAGPLAGLVAAAHYLADHAQADTILISAAVDTPFLPLDFVPRLVAELMRGAPAAQACWQKNAYPTNAAWRLADLARLPQQFAGGGAPRSPRELLGSLGAASVDWAQSHARDPFANLNSLEDLVALARRAAASEG